MTKLIGTGANQVPTNADLGRLAYQDSVATGAAFAASTFTVSDHATLTAAQMVT